MTSPCRFALHPEIAAPSSFSEKGCSCESRLLLLFENKNGCEPSAEYETMIKSGTKARRVQGLGNSVASRQRRSIAMDHNAYDHHPNPGKRPHMSSLFVPHGDLPYAPRSMSDDTQNAGSSTQDCTCADDEQRFYFKGCAVCLFEKALYRVATKITPCYVSKGCLPSLNNSTSLACLPS